MVSINCTRFPIQDEEHTLWLLRDIQEQVDSEQKLHRAAAVFEQTSEGILIANGQLEIIAVNSAAEQICGYKGSELQGKDLFCLNADSQVPDRQTILDELRETGKWSGEVSQRRAGGQNYLALLSLARVSEKESRDQQYIAVFHDLTPHRQAEQRIRQLAHFDSLTRLPNRALFQDRLDQSLTHAARSSTWVALLFLDLDNFKGINDSLGHQAGDELLKVVAQRLRQSVREEDTVSRMGGDEFTLLLGHFQDELSAQRTAVRLSNSILKALEGPMPYGELEMFTNASIGVAIYPRDAGKGEDLLRCADTAMYAAKKSGRGTFQFFSEALDRQAKNRMALEVGLRRALAHGDFRLHFQPLVRARDGFPVGLEALVRWQTPQGKLLAPGHFIEVAEESGIIVPMGDWVLHQACTIGARLIEAGMNPGRIAVNMSSRELADADFLAKTTRVLESTGFPAQNLEIEVSERVFLWDLEKSTSLLNRLREMGISVALDDFGTGYSSLQYLKELPLDTLKIDRSFVTNLESDEQDQGIVRTIIELGRSLGLTVVAEGVERTSQADWLARHGCDVLQGYHFGHPTDSDSIEELLAEIMDRMESPDPDAESGERGHHGRKA
jgi:diguanylate cyclase (GGDEF)-like protein/PAS domain S-box-containing protein